MEKSLSYGHTGPNVAESTDKEIALLKIDTKTWLQSKKLPTENPLSYGHTGPNVAESTDIGIA